MRLTFSNSIPGIAFLVVLSGSKSGGWGLRLGLVNHYPGRPATYLLTIRSSFLTSRGDAVRPGGFHLRLNVGLNLGQNRTKAVKSAAMML